MDLRPTFDDFVEQLNGKP